MKALLKEINLLIAFSLLIFLTLAIGLVAIFQIHGLNRRIEDLGTHHLKLEGAVLGMRITNANYGQEIRSYIFWHAARYQDALSMSEYLNRIGETEKKFKMELQIYRENSWSEVQKKWGEEVAESLEKLLMLGSRIITMIDKDTLEKSSPLTRDSLMLFERRIYELDQFLNDPMGSSNLEAVQKQITLAQADKEHAVSFLGLSLTGAVVLAVFIGVSAYRRNLREHANRRDILNRMMNVEEIERGKLSTAVHDEMGQDLSALKIRLGLIRQQIEKQNSSSSSPHPEMGPGPISPDQDMKTHMEVCKTIIEDLLKKSHNIAFMLRPPDLDEIGLVESLEALLLESKHMTGVSYLFNRPENFPVLSPEFSLLFYRITQELLTNMAKHANAKHVELTLVHKSSGFELLYADDGQGFDYEELLKYPARRHEDKMRLGLRGLKERVELLDGTMKINSASGMGTRVTVELTR